MYLEQRKIQQQGFTLIELAIVLLVVSLVVGGVLVGQEMINNAIIRAQIRQLDGYGAAINTFRLKYGAIPGDLQADQASAFGFAVRSGADGHGDGDGVLEGCTAFLSAPSVTPPPPGLGCEVLLLWRDLGEASLIDGSFQSSTDDYASIPNRSAASTYFPHSKFTINASVLAKYFNGKHYFILPSIDSYSQGGGFVGESRIPMINAFNMDSKIDDGMPLTGKVLYRIKAISAVMMPVAPTTEYFMTTCQNCPNGAPLNTLPFTCMVPATLQYAVTFPNVAIWQCHPAVMIDGM